MRRSPVLCIFFLLFTQISTAQHSKVFDSLQKKMGLSYSLGSFRQAADIAQLSLEVARKELGETHIEVGNQYCNLGLFLKSLNKFDSARWCYDMADEFFRKNNYTQHTDYVSIPINKGTLATTLGKYDSAIYHMNVAAQSCQSIPDCRNSTMHATLLNNLANIYVKINRDKEAEKVLVLADSIATFQKQEEQFLGLTIKNTLAIVYQNNMQHKKALDLLHRLEPIYVKKFGPSNLNTALVQANIFLSYFKIGDRHRADSLGALLFSKVEKMKDKSKIYMFLNNYAIMLLNIGKLEEADKVYDLSFETMEKVFGEDHPEVRFIQNNHIGLLLALGQFERSYAISKKLREKINNGIKNQYYESVAEGNYLASVLGLDSLDVVIKEGNQILSKYKTDTNAIMREVISSMYINLTVAYQHKQMYKEALASIESALHFIGSEPSLYRTYNLQHKAVLLASQKKYDLAVPVIEEALGMARKLQLEQHYIYRKLLFNLVAIHAKTGALAKASGAAQQLLGVHRRQLIDLLDYLTASERELFVNNMLEDLNYLLDFYLYAERKQPANYVNQFLDVLLFREGILLKTNTATRKAILQSNDSLLLAQYQQLQQLKSTWLQQLQLPAGQQKNTNNLAKEILSLEKKIQASAKGLNEQSLTWKSISDGLKPGEAYLHYYQAGNFTDDYTGFEISNRECYAVLIKRGAKPSLIRIDPKNTINRFFKNTLGTTQVHVSHLYNRADTLTGISLYSLLWQPLEKDLSGVSRIYLRTNGDINRISFAAIPLPRTGVIADKYALRRLITLADSSFHWETKPSQIKNILLVGDVNFNSNKKGTQRSDEDELQWKSLPATKQEINAISEIFRQHNYHSTLITDSLATETEIKTQINKLQPEIIHIATHGFFSRNASRVENASKMIEKGLFAYSDLGYLQSGLVMAGANNHRKHSLIGDDGVLNAYEMQNLNFGKTDIVVLSACETALGNIDRQEGVYGLQRAFKIAGAKYQVLSLWKVPDAATQEMMNAFYTELVKGKTYEEAFNEAQAMMKRKYESYYWAGFVLLK